MKHYKNTKWAKLGKKAYRKLYESQRLKAKTILKNRHRKEYLKILNKLMKGGLKKNGTTLNTKRNKRV